MDTANYYMLYMVIGPVTQLVMAAALVSIALSLRSNNKKDK